MLAVDWVGLLHRGGEGAPGPTEMPMEILQFCGDMGVSSGMCGGGVCVRDSAYG